MGTQWGKRLWNENWKLGSDSHGCDWSIDQSVRLNFSGYPLAFKFLHNTSCFLLAVAFCTFQRMWKKAFREPNLVNCSQQCIRVCVCASMVVSVWTRKVLGSQANFAFTFIDCLFSLTCLSTKGYKVKVIFHASWEQKRPVVIIFD